MFKVGDTPKFFITQGLKSDSELLLDKVIIYRSNSRFTSSSNAGPARTMLVDGKATAFPEPLKIKFQRLQTLVTARTNFHIHHASAETIDGYSRFCYVYFDEDTDKVFVSEYQTRSQGSKYSSFFKILEAKLIQANFLLTSEEKTIFHIPTERIDEFVDIVNDISKAYDNNKYELYVEGKERLHSFDWFNRVYYMERSEDAPEKLMSDLKAVEAFDALVKIQDLGNENGVRLKKDAIRKIKAVLDSVL
ncbi:hypothetical protein CN568_13415 [Bacillus pseudomycoides]|uniref:hypothetical protein n=1 Tax=Bacillus pseudomycoides TaxID=64104 RepID=UPI000BF863DF|nr:hypothetical protein [Bacillus pseudomycoides]MED1621376.1 hypothetical protein [Bacillus pseudomycoides]PEP42552.1 hypothetical protein CN565_09670 [Bacillus pseudomycoides]PEP44210.1 hypothetical protein CN568_13415 [Bacillus pseudomycoides]